MIQHFSLLSPVFIKQAGVPSPTGNYTVYCRLPQHVLIENCLYYIQRMCGALKYTIGFLIVAIVLLLVG